MPRRRAPARKKRTYRRKRQYRRRRAPNTMINRGPTYLPERYFTKLKVNDRRAVTITTGAANYVRYGLNCLYDPYLGVGGPQPNGFDQLMQLFNKYRVTAFKYTTYATSAASGSGPNNLEFAACPSADLNLSVNEPQTVGEQPYGKMVFEYPGAPVKYISRYMTASKVFGMPRAAYMINNDYAGDVSNNPSEIAYLTCVAQPVDEASSTTVYIYTRIVFYCVFYDRITQDDA